uniref:Uncharacterized protein n=1 Tax=Oryza punctata TaxID=4537 RepID=A0A0E0LE09_ORYPU
MQRRAAAVSSTRSTGATPCLRAALLRLGMLPLVEWSSRRGELGGGGFGIRWVVGVRCGLPSSECRGGWPRRHGEI